MLGIEYKAFIIKYGEIAIKGKNRRLFEDALIRQIKHALSPVEGDFIVNREQGRIYVETEGEYDYEGTVQALQTVFGIVSFAPAIITENEDIEDLREEVAEAVLSVCGSSSFTFKVETRRAKKSYPLDSMEINALIGETILDKVDNSKVDVHEPEVLVRVEIRDRINFYFEEIKGPGGMPVGTNGSAMLLLSGGIDSPVAGYMIAKRGVAINAVYFHAPPYTSERAKQKVIDLSKIISKYTGPIKLHIVNFTDMQLNIYEKCPKDELTIIMRRYMMRIAEYFANRENDLGLITGESIGQVASQTMQSLLCTNAACELPVYRPLIGMDKQEIVEISEKIGTYETSILPFEDCCTIFVAKHPVTKPRLKNMETSEKKLAGAMETLMKTALETVEIIEVTS